MKKEQEGVIGKMASLGYRIASESEIKDLKKQLKHSAILKKSLAEAIDKLNPHTPKLFKEDALDRVISLRKEHPSLANYKLHSMLRNGIRCSYQNEGQERGGIVKLLDTKNPHNNNFEIFTNMSGGYSHPYSKYDIILFINGVPLIVIRLDSREGVFSSKLTEDTFFSYANHPVMAHYNYLGITTDGEDAAIGSIFCRNNRLTIWRSEDDNVRQGIQFLRPQVSLDYITNFISISRVSNSLLSESERPSQSFNKVITNYYQYYAANKLLNSTSQSLLSDRKDEKMKGGGVIYHSYGTGLITLALFYSAKLTRQLQKLNPTIIFIIKSLNAEEQMFQFMMENKYLLEQEPVCASSHADLALLLKSSGGGIILTTVQKLFSIKKISALSKRKNIVAIVHDEDLYDYGISKNIVNQGSLIKKLLPQATFACLTNYLPHEASKTKIFGDQLSTYDMTAALRDKVISQICLDSRLTEHHLDDGFLKNNKSKNSTNITVPSSSTWQELEKFLGAERRVKALAKDIVEHFEFRESISKGKAIIVVASRRIGINLYRQIIKLRPNWEGESKLKGKIQLIMTHKNQDPESWYKHRTSQEDRGILRTKLANPNDGLRIAIVRDINLFYETCLHTIYWDRPMQGKDLVKAVCQVNGLDINKTKGLIVDYLGIESNLMSSIKDYYSNGGNDMPIIGIKENVASMENKRDRINELLDGLDYTHFHEVSKKDQQALIEQARYGLLNDSKAQDSLISLVDEMSDRYTMFPNAKELKKFKRDLIFLLTLRGCLLNLSISYFSVSKSDSDLNKASNILADKSIIKADCKKIYGINDISKLQVGEDVLDNVTKNGDERIRFLALTKLTHALVESVRKKDLLKGSKYSDDFQLIFTAKPAKQYAGLIDLAGEIIEHGKMVKKLGISKEVYAIYNILLKFRRAKDPLDEKDLLKLSKTLYKEIKANITPDWEMMEHSRSLLRVVVKHNVRKCGYLAKDEQDLAETIVMQAEIFSPDK